MSRLPSLPFLLAGLLVLTGCVTTAPTPPAATAATTAAPVAPATPAPVTVVELPPASLRGSEETSTLLDNFTAYLVAVDGAPVTGGREAWDKPVMLKAGLRRVSLAFARGVFAARAEVEFTATSRTAYQVKFATDAEFLGKNTYCEFWIVNIATGQPASAKVRAPLRRGEAEK